jgi:hypothetical protein
VTATKTPNFDIFEHHFISTVFFGWTFTSCKAKSQPLEDQVVAAVVVDQLLLYASLHCTALHYTSPSSAAAPILPQPSALWLIFIATKQKQFATVSSASNVFPLQTIRCSLISSLPASLRAQQLARNPNCCTNFVCCNAPSMEQRFQQQQSQFRR